MNLEKELRIRTKLVTKIVTKRIEVKELLSDLNLDKSIIDQVDLKLYDLQLDLPKIALDEIEDNKIPLKTRILDQLKRLNF